jgi:hypothetical protein
MTRAAFFLFSPVLFPEEHPLAVWIGVACLWVAVWAMMAADDLGSSEGTIRADEAREWLMKMQQARVC